MSHSRRAARLRAADPAGGDASLGLGLVVIALGTIGIVVRRACSAGSAAADANNDPRSSRAASCSCRAARPATASTARAARRAPSLIGVGAAAVDFQVGTGRMPLQQHGAAGAAQKPVSYTRREIELMAAYVASLGPGPAIPTNLDYQSADVAFGGALFRTNCAQCHNFAGSGGALTYGKYAPTLSDATPKQIYEAMITGPESMPVFGDQQITPDQKLAIINYIRTIKTEPNPGGAGLGRVGPVVRRRRRLAGRHRRPGHRSRCGSDPRHERRPPRDRGRGRRPAATTPRPTAPSDRASPARGAPAAAAPPSSRRSTTHGDLIEDDREPSDVDPREDEFAERQVAALFVARRSLGASRSSWSLLRDLDPAAQPRPVHATTRSAARLARRAARHRRRHDRLGEEAAAAREGGPGAPRRSTPPEEEELVTEDTFLQGVDDMGLGKRKMLRRTLLGALGAAPAAARS